MDRDLEKIKKLWSKLNPIETIYITTLARSFQLKEKISMTRPTQLVIPICITQILLFGITTGLDLKNPLAIFAIGNFVIVGIALAPMTIWKRKFHWIR